MLPCLPCLSSSHTESPTATWQLIFPVTTPVVSPCATWQLGRSTGMEALHDMLELSICRAPDGSLPDNFLLAIEAAQQDFETNPIYWLMHESIYCDGPEYGASAWAAERVQAELGDDWDYTTRLEEGAPPVLLTGEMVYSWMGDDFAWLRFVSCSRSEA